MFPSGKVVKSSELNEAVEKVIKKLESEKFTGYVAFTLKSEKGVYDSTIALVNGSIKGAFTENFKTKETCYGEEAIEKITSGTFGLYDVVSLSEEQVNLAIAVRPEMQVKKKTQQEPQEQRSENDEEILKKYGLSSMIENG